MYYARRGKKVRHCLVLYPGEYRIWLLSMAASYTQKPGGEQPPRVFGILIYTKYHYIKKHYIKHKFPSQSSCKCERRHWGIRSITYCCGCRLSAVASVGINYVLKRKIKRSL